MRTLFSAVALAAALFAMPATAQIYSRDAYGNIISSGAVTLPDGTKAPKQVRYGSDGSEKGTATNPDAVAYVLLPASSTAQQGSATASTVTGTAGATPTFAGGVATAGPLVPQLGRNVRLILKGAWTGQVQVGTSIDNCATVNPLTAYGQPLIWTGNADEVVDVPSLAAIPPANQPGYCLQATVLTGTLTYALRQ